jgi:hypothetical protein
MSHVTGNQPDGTPTRIDLAVPDPRARQGVLLRGGGYHRRPEARGHRAVRPGL